MVDVKESEEKRAIFQSPNGNSQMKNPLKNKLSDTFHEFTNDKNSQNKSQIK